MKRRKLFMLGIVMIMQRKRPERQTRRIFISVIFCRKPKRWKSVVTLVIFAFFFNYYSFNNFAFLQTLNIYVWHFCPHVLNRCHLTLWNSQRSLNHSKLFRLCKETLPYLWVQLPVNTAFRHSNWPRPTLNLPWMMFDSEI